jgi:hypothetical protein
LDALIITLSNAQKFLGHAHPYATSSDSDPISET